jgi:hypothetical protein
VAHAAQADECDAHEDSFIRVFARQGQSDIKPAEGGRHVGAVLMPIENCVPTNVIVNFI